MPRFICLHRALLIASASMLAVSCGDKGNLRLSSPAPAVFKQEAQPKLDPEVVIRDDEEGYRQWGRDKDEWGAEGWARLNDVCLWFEEQGVTGLPCAPASPASPKQ